MCPPRSQLRWRVRRWTPERVEALRARVAAAASDAELAEEFGATDKAIQQAMYREDIKRAGVNGSTSDQGQAPSSDDSRDP
jgi:hypothetical protein